LRLTVIFSEFVFFFVADKDLHRTLKHGSLRHHFWFHVEPFKPGSLKNHFLKGFFKEPIKVSQRTFKKWFFKALFLVPQRTFQTRVL